MPRTTPRKTRIVSFRLTERDFLRLAHKAASAHLRPGELARRLVLSKLERLVIKTCGQHNPAVVKQLHHIGHNLNQLVKNAHIFGRVSPHIEGLCRRIEAVLDGAIGKEPEE